MKKPLISSLLQSTLLIFVCMTSILTAETSMQTNLLVKIRSELPVIANGEPINLTIEVKNQGEKLLKLYEPSVPKKTLRIELLRGGKKQSQLKWGGAYTPDEITLDSGQSHTTEYDYNQLISAGLEAGTYTLKVIYTPNDKLVITSNEILLEVKPLPKEETGASDAYRKVIGAGEHSDVANLGIAFLKKYPVSIFSNKVRLETAFALRKISKYDEAIDLYIQILESVKPPQWIKQEAQWNLAHSQHEKGDLKSAIATLKSLSTPAAKEQIIEWESPEPPGDK